MKVPEVSLHKQVYRGWAYPRCTLADLSWDVLSLMHHKCLRTLHPFNMRPATYRSGGAIVRSIPPPTFVSTLCVPGRMVGPKKRLACKSARFIRQGHGGVMVEQAAIGVQRQSLWPLKGGKEKKGFLRWPWKVDEGRGKSGDGGSKDGVSSPGQGNHMQRK